MSDRDLLAPRFETHREHLRAVALRMLGSSHEADDAVDNLGGWLTTVVARVCLDMPPGAQSKVSEPRRAALRIGILSS